MLQWSFAQRQALLLAVGTAAWLVAARTTAILLGRPDGPVGALYWLCITACVLNIAAYLYNSWHLYLQCVRVPARWQTDNCDGRSWLAVSICHLSALVLIRLLPFKGIELALLVPFAVIVAPFLTRFTPTVAILTMLVNTLGVMWSGKLHLLAGEAVLVFLVQVSLWLLGLGGIVEMRDKQRLQTILAHFRTTRELLSVAVANNERQRIARDIHDRMGHHLVALNLQLQLAEQGGGTESSQAAITLSKALVRELFADVRDTVQRLHDVRSFDFGQALAAMLARIPSIKFELSGETHWQIDNYSVADCLLRCLQETISNTLKHSDATVIRMDFSSSDDEWCLTLRDNGRQARQSDWSTGKGLTGMRQRVEALHGSIRWQQLEGFEVHIRLPRGSAR